jgi:O-antigen ligase
VPEFSWLNYFYALDFAIFQHTSYLSMFTLLSAYISFEYYFHFPQTKKIKYFWLFAALLLLISIYFLSSRAVMLATFVSLPLYLYIKFRQIKRLKYFWGVILVLILVSFPVVLTNPRINNYFNWRADHNISHIQVDNDRKVIWDSVIEIIGDNLIFGVGTGDIQDELNEKYMNSGQPNLAAVNTNAHNQYLEIVLENGLIGFAIFALMFSAMFFIAIANRNTLYLMFLTIVLISFLFETMLNRLAGVTFFSLFSFLLIMNGEEN